jgi:hypothetical protein
MADGEILVAEGTITKKWTVGGKDQVFIGALLGCGKKSVGG